jgi:hypothetical protein
MMEFIPTSGADNSDLKALAQRLAGTHDNVHNHIIALGLEVATGQDILDDLEAGGFITTCAECGLWEFPRNLDGGNCLACVEDLEEQIQQEFERHNNNFGFADDLFNDEDVLDECIGDYVFDETDEDDI